MNRKKVRSGVLGLLAIVLISVGQAWGIEAFETDAELVIIEIEEQDAYDIEHAELIEEQELEPIAQLPPGLVGRIIHVEMTAYCACKRCNGKYSDGKATQTASGMYLYNNPEYADKYCAATKAVGKLGTKIEIDGTVYTIVDRMGRKDGLAVDIFVPDHGACYDVYGRQRNKEAIVYEQR